LLLLEEFGQLQGDAISYISYLKIQENITYSFATVQGLLGSGIQI
jgi:hypothetical protein